MGREHRARDNRRAFAKTAHEHASDPTVPKRLRWLLSHPKSACVIITLGMPIEITRGAWRGVRQTFTEYMFALRTFSQLARGRDVL